MTGAVHPFEQPPTAGYPADIVAGVLDDALEHDCRIYAIAGLQGAGKSTLSAQVARLAAQRGLAVAVLSIDDVYLDHPQRERLARDVHPLLATRGPPGTHDVGLACDTIDGLRAGRATALPRFDKIDDRRLPRAQWPTLTGADLIIVEGWFLRVPAQADAELAAPLNPLERDEDPHGIWRGYCNSALRDDYTPLWQRLQRLLFLHGPGFEVVPRWRWQQEQTLQDAHPGRQAMTQAQVERFVQFFERASLQALHTLPTLADRILRLDAERRALPSTQ